MPSASRDGRLLLTCRERLRRRRSVMTSRRFIFSPMLGPVAGLTSKCSVIRTSCPHVLAYLNLQLDYAPTRPRSLAHDRGEPLHRTQQWWAAEDECPVPGSVLRLAASKGSYLRDGIDTPRNSSVRRSVHGRATDAPLSALPQEQEPGISDCATVRL